MISFIGARPEQVPTNQDLGPLAFLDRPFRRKVEATATAGQSAFTIEREHCKKAHESDIDRAIRLLESLGGKHGG